MTMLQHRNVAHRVLQARQGLDSGDAGSGGGGGVGSFNTNTGSSSAAAPTTSSTTADSSSSPAAPTTHASSPTPSSSSEAAPTTSSNSPTKATTTTSQSTGTTSSGSDSSSSSSSSTSSSTSSRSTTNVVSTNNAILKPSTKAGVIAASSSFANVTPTDVTGAASTVSAGPVDTSGATGMSTGSIVGAVAGTLLGLAVVGFCVMFLLRRVRRNRRRALRHESDFGTFNRSAFVKEKEPSIVPDMSERGHTVAPSLAGDAAAGIATPPSQALAAANAAAAAPAVPLQERPKYVYGQAPAPGQEAGGEDDVSEATGGVYSSQPMAQTTYNPEAYGSYAKYDDAGQGVVGGSGYQNAEREYQGQQGYYDQTQQQGYYNQHQQGYDQQGYAVGYDQQAYAGQQAYVAEGQYAQYDYSQQHAQYASQEAEQSGYQAPHPYANSGKAAGHDAYGGM